MLIDQGVPEPLRQHLEHHEVATAYEQGWAAFKNGELLGISEFYGSSPSKFTIEVAQLLAPPGQQ